MAKIFKATLICTENKNRSSEFLSIINKLLKSTNQNGLEAVWYKSLNTYFQCLNNIICIFTHFFIHAVKYMLLLAM